MNNQTQYARAALKAYELLKPGCNAEIVWKEAVKQVTECCSSRKKTCPKEAFLGLYDNGDLKVKPKKTTKPDCKYRDKNKFYAVKAVDLLRGKGSLADDKKALWEEVRKECEKTCTDVAHNQNEQMDVVIALWEKEYIEKTRH